MPALRKALGSKKKQVRLRAVEGIGRMGQAAAEALPDLRALLAKEKSKLIKTALENAITQISPS